MYYVYIISSTIRNYTYIGITNSLERRINQHNSGYNKTTKPYRPFKLIYFEELKDRKEARVREKYFKSGVGREKIKLLKLRAGLLYKIYVKSIHFHRLIFQNVFAMMKIYKIFYKL
ncbi:GIY-YIG nuclease family protein [Stygiobacter electus]|uniref:GIY-YIG nuclease family protein n=1 Tax=Stygiobacter electus TaxID=3032292 RepID=A0AAE3NWE1_9BACT|nr:GIY-YIG nuclease family protein [Stygiobacter electus]MDF1612161.1 GIY-YIG nuclease family protein [Stygiobacter electus]